MERTGNQNSHGLLPKRSKLDYKALESKPIHSQFWNKYEDAPPPQNDQDPDATWQYLKGKIKRTAEAVLPRSLNNSSHRFYTPETLESLNKLPA